MGGARLGSVLGCVMAASCASHPLPAPAQETAATVHEDAAPAPSSAAAPTAVLQALPFPARTVWSRNGETLGVVSLGLCRAAMVDVGTGLVTAQLPGCALSADPRGDGFLVRASATWIDSWSPHGTAASSSLPLDAAEGFPAWSPDGARLASLAGDSIVLLDADTWGVQRVRVEGAGSLRWLGSDLRWDSPDGGGGVWSADGAHVVVGDGQRAWIVGVGSDESQTPLDCLPVHARFAPRGDLLAVECGGSLEARVWDARERRVTSKLPHFWQWSSTGRYVLASGSGLEVRDAATGAVALRPGNASPGQLAFSPDDTRLAMRAEDPRGGFDLVVWDLASSMKVASHTSLSTPRWSADGAFLAADDPDRARVVVLDTGTWGERWSRAEGYGQSTWSPVGARLAVASSSGVDVVDLHTGASRPVGSAETARFARLEVAPDGAVVARVQPRGGPRGDEGACEAIRMDPKSGTSVVQTRCDASTYELPSPDGAWTTRAGRQTRAAVLMAPILVLLVEDTATRERWFVDSGYQTRSVAWSARGHRLLVAGSRPLVYEADTHRVWAIKGEGWGAWALDADGRRVAVGLQDGKVRLVTVGSRDAPVVLPAATEPAMLLALSGDRLAAVTQHGAVTVWDVPRGEIVASWDTGLTPLQAAWGGDGAFLAIADVEQVRLSRPDGSRPVTLTGLRTTGTTTWLARDEQGRVDGPPGALAAVRWRTAEGTEVDAASVEHATHQSPVRAGMIEALARTDDR